MGAPEQLAARIIHHCALTHNVEEGLHHLFEVVAPRTPSKGLDLLKLFGTQMNVMKLDLLPLVQGMLQNPTAFKVLWRNLETFLRTSLPPTEYQNLMKYLYQQLSQHPYEWANFQKLAPPLDGIY